MCILFVDTLLLFRCLTLCQAMAAASGGKLPPQIVAESGEAGGTDSVAFRCLVPSSPGGRFHG